MNDTLTERRVIPAKGIFAAGLLLLVVLFVLNVLFGSVSIPFEDVFGAVFGGDTTDVTNRIVLERRIPEAVTAMVAGAGLSVCGLLLQTLFRNPLADPSILGISSGASFAIALLIFSASFVPMAFLSSPLMQIGTALAGSFLILSVLLFLSRHIFSNTALLIAGIMTGYVTSSLVTVLQYFGAKDLNYSYLMWSQGSFARAVSGEFYYLFIGLTLAGVAGSFFLIKSLNMLLLGENYAKNLGLDTGRMRTWIILVTAFITALVTAYCGPVAFIGLAVPHIVKLLTGTADRRVLLPYTVLFGALITLGCNLLTKVPVFGMPLPVNAVTSLIGAPMVISAILRNNSVKR